MRSMWVPLNVSRTQFTASHHTILMCLCSWCLSSWVPYILCASCECDRRVSHGNHRCRVATSGTCTPHVSCICSPSLKTRGRSDGPSLTPTCCFCVEPNKTDDTARVTQTPVAAAALKCDRLTMTKDLYPITRHHPASVQLHSLWRWWCLSGVCRGRR